MLWRITIHYADLPVLDPEAVERLSTRAELKVGVNYRPEARDMYAEAWVDAPDGEHAMGRLNREVRFWLDPAEPITIVSYWVETQEGARIEHALPLPRRVVTGAEAARMLGVSRARWMQIARPGAPARDPRAPFPAATTQAGTPMWDEEAVARYRDTR